MLLLLMDKNSLQYLFPSGLAKRKSGGFGRMKYEASK